MRMTMMRTRILISSIFAWRVVMQVSHTFPRQAPVFRPRVSMNALNRSRSRCTCDDTIPYASPTCVTICSGSYVLERHDAPIDDRARLSPPGDALVRRLLYDLC